jgi:hypothetical protein
MTVIAAKLNTSIIATLAVLKLTIAVLEDLRVIGRLLCLLHQS